MSDPAAFAGLEGEDHVSLATFRRSGQCRPDRALVRAA